MPSPTNRIKQTGDTRDIAAFEDDDDLDDAVDGSGSQPEAAVFHPAAAGIDLDRASPRRSEGEHSPGQRFSTRKYMGAAGDQVRARPLAALGGAFLLGFVLARLR